MGAHGHKVATFLFNPFDDFVRGFAVGQLSFGRNSCRIEFFTHPSKIGSILGDLRTDRIRPIRSRSPSIGHMKQHQAAMRQFGERLHMFDDGAIACRAVQRHQDRLVHMFSVVAPDRFYVPLIKCQAVLIESGRP